MMTQECAEKIIVVIGVKPLPGTHRGQNADMHDIILSACEDARMLYGAGIRSIMLQNVNDQSYDHRPERMAFMTAIACAVKNTIPPDCQLGVSIIPNDTVGAIAVASASGLSYVRAKVYVGVMIRTTIEIGTVAETLNMKDKLHCNAEIWADIHDRMGTPLANISIVEASNHAIMSGADRLIITGKSFVETLDLVAQVKDKFPQKRILIGGGVDETNLISALGISDGVIVATALRRDGRLAPDLVEQFMNAYSAGKAR